MQVNFISLGCSRNLVDSEVMIKFLISKGFELTYDMNADFFVVNTCGFIQKARKEVKTVLKDIFKNKKKSSKVIVCGCMVNLFKKDLEKHFPDIFCYLGSGNIPDILKAVFSSKKQSIITQKSYLEKPMQRTITTYPNYAFLKIAEGCLNSCSYCLIPKIKGPLKSKPIKHVLREFKNLLDKGFFEIILIAQNLADYGKDLNTNLETLLKELLKIEKDFWIRLLYIYPNGITKKLIQIMQDTRVCKYVDMPIQHIDNDILKKMNRQTTEKNILNAIDILKSNFSNIVIRTTLMTGFPGETDKSFLKLLNFIKIYKLDHVGIFQYSREKNTQAFNMEQIPPSIKKKRFQKLYETQKDIVLEKNKSLIGKKFKVFIEKYHSSKLLLQGRYYGQAPEIDPVVIINDIEPVKELYKPYLVKITNFLEYDLLGKIV